MTSYFSGLNLSASDLLSPDNFSLLFFLEPLTITTTKAMDTTNSKMSGNFSPDIGLILNSFKSIKTVVALSGELIHLLLHHQAGVSPSVKAAGRGLANRSR